MLGCSRCPFGLARRPDHQRACALPGFAEIAASVRSSGCTDTLGKACSRSPALRDKSGAEDAGTHETSEISLIEFFIKAETAKHCRPVVGECTIQSVIAVMEAEG